MLDLVTGDVAGNRQRYGGQSCCARSHQDRRKPFPCPAQDKLKTKRFAFLLFEMLIVTHQHDAIARRDPEHSQKANERTEREDAAAHICRQHSAHQGRWQGEEGQGRQPPATECGEQDEKHPDRSCNPISKQAVLGGLPLLVLAEQLRVVPKRELDLPEVPFEVADYGAEVASPHVGINVNATRSVFTFYLVRGWDDAYPGHIP